jgi:hypothetical protein
MGEWASWQNFLLSQWNMEEAIGEWYSSLTPSNRGLKEKGVCSLAILVCWAIWRERNDRVVQHREKTVAHLITEIKDEADLWMKAGAKNLIALVSHRICE